MEALGLVALALLAWLLIRQQSSDAGVPLLGALALGAQRLLPALQQVYGAWSSLKSSIRLRWGSGANQPLPSLIIKANPLALREGIRLEALQFRYGPEHPLICRDLILKSLAVSVSV